MLWPAVAAIAFTLSLFTKHDILAFPLSVGLHLLITRNWRALTVFLAAGSLASGVLLALSQNLDGPNFFAELLQPRAYSLQNLGAETFHYFLHFLIPLMVAVVVLWHDRAVPYRSFLFTLLGLTNLTAIYFAGGDGVGSNIFYPPLIADLLSCVIAICWLERSTLAAPRAGSGFRTALIISTLAGVVMVPFQIQNDVAAEARLAATTKAAQQVVVLLKSANGPAVCEDLLLCYEAGKPMDYDPYYVNDQIRIGRIPQSGIIALLTAHHYAAIQLDGGTDKRSLKRRRGRFTEPFLSTLLAQYRLVLVTHSYSVFVPRG